MTKLFSAILLVGCFMFICIPVLAGSDGEINPALGSCVYLYAGETKGALLLSSGNLLLWGSKSQDNKGRVGWVTEINKDAQEIYSQTLEHGNGDSTISVIGALEASQGIVLLTKDSQSMNSFLFSLDSEGGVTKKTSLRKGVDILSLSPFAGGFLVAGDTFQPRKISITPWVALLDGNGNIVWENSGEPSDEMNSTARTYYSLCTSFESGFLCVKRSVQGNLNIDQLFLTTFNLQGLLLSENEFELSDDYDMGYYSGVLSNVSTTLLFGCVNGAGGKTAKAVCAYPDGRVKWEKEYAQFGIFTSALATPDGHLISASSYRNGTSSIDLLVVNSRGELIEFTNMSGESNCETKAILSDGQNNYWLIGNVSDRTFVVKLISRVVPWPKDA